MPYRRSKRGSKAAPVSDLNITHLDLQTLQTIIKHLPCDDDKAGFASAHPSFSSAYRSMVYQASALECFSRLDIASQVLANYENLTSIVLGVDIQYGSPSLRDLKGPSGVTRLRLIFLRDFPSRRSLSALPDNFRNLRSLQLKFDVDGYRGSKEKRNICNGRDDPPDLEAYMESIPWAKGIVVGRNIGMLPNLKELVVDFDACMESLSYSAVLHRLFLRETSRSDAGTFKEKGSHNTLSENIDSPSKTPVYFQNLETIEFGNCGGPVHFLYTPSLVGRIQYPSEGLAGNDFWNPNVIWESMRNFPKLKKWRLHASYGAVDDAFEPIAVKWPCESGAVTGQMVNKVLPGGTQRWDFVEIDWPEGLDG